MVSSLTIMQNGPAAGSSGAPVTWRPLGCVQVGDLVGSGVAGADLVRRAVLGGGLPEGVASGGIFQADTAAGLHHSLNLHC